MTRKDLADVVYQFAADNGVRLTRENAMEMVKEVLTAMHNGIVTDGRLTIDDFGTFNVRERGPKVGRNIHTGEAINIPARNVIHFRPAPALKNAV